jgi:hypothetical protein
LFSSGFFFVILELGRVIDHNRLGAVPASRPVPLSVGDRLRRTLAHFKLRLAFSFHGFLPYLPPQDCRNLPTD